MSSTTTTQYYGLTQYIGTDKPDFADNNQAFRNVDADLHQVVQDSQGFTSDIADLTERVGNLDTDLTNLSGDLDGEKAKITALQNKELSQDTEISRVERNAQDMITAYNEASATSTHAYAVGDYFIYNNVLYQATAAIAVGATIVPDTNCTTTNVTSELIQLNNDLFEDVSNKFVFGSVFTAMTCKAVIINNKILVVHLDGYKVSGLPVGESEHFCTINAALLTRISSGNHVADVWNDGENPRIININKDSTGLAYTERTSTFHYLSTDLTFILAD